MPSRRDQIRMTDAEVQAFLEEQTTLIVATIGPTGHPHVVPLWYALLDGDVVFWTYAKSQKVLNLKRDPRITCLVEDGEVYGALRGVHLVGTGLIHDDEESVLGVAIALQRRYAGPEFTEQGIEGMRRSAAKRVAVRVHVEDVASWDHRKLAGVY